MRKQWEQDYTKRTGKKILTPEQKIERQRGYTAKALEKKKQQNGEY